MGGGPSAQPVEVRVRELTVGVCGGLERVPRCSALGAGARALRELERELALLHHWPAASNAQVIGLLNAQVSGLLNAQVMGLSNAQVMGLARGVEAGRRARPRAEADKPAAGLQGGVPVGLAAQWRVELPVGPLGLQGYQQLGI